TGKACQKNCVCRRHIKRNFALENESRRYSSRSLRPAEPSIIQRVATMIAGDNQMTIAAVASRRFVLTVTVFLIAVWSSAAQQKPDCMVRVTLLQVNDVYQFAPVDQGTRGGLARLLTLKKSIQQENPNTLFMMAGDTISPSVESITYKGAQMIDAWNLAQLDYSTLGNHEFDFGPDVLRQRMQESK